MEKIIPYLKTATALPGYKLSVVFEDGVNGVIDLHSWHNKGGLFSYWDNEENFQSFK